MSNPLQVPDVDFSEATLSRLKAALGKSKDKGAAELLGMGEKAFNARKTRGSFPEKELRALAQQRPEMGIDVDYVLTGRTLAAAEPERDARLRALVARRHAQIDEGGEMKARYKLNGDGSLSLIACDRRHFERLAGQHDPLRTGIPGVGPERIKSALAAAGYTQTSLAKELGCRPETVNAAVHGNAANARVRAAIAGLLGLPEEFVWPPKPGFGAARRPPGAREESRRALYEDAVRHHVAIMAHASGGAA